MNLEMFYRRPAGRLFLNVLQKAGIYRLSALFLRSRLSRFMIPGYIRRNQIDMRSYPKRKYRSFADFFARERSMNFCEIQPKVLISPCDGLLTVYPITKDLSLPMKGSHYRLVDLVSDKNTADTYRDGLCLVFRLQASDYHHFCCVDDTSLEETHYIPGLLHSVQPIACETVPVYRLNRRWWSLLRTNHFGDLVQVEVGAMLVGGVHFAKNSGSFRKGEEMGNFELAGSTILLLLTSETRQKLELYTPFKMAVNGMEEVPVAMGEGIAALK